MELVGLRSRKVTILTIFLILSICLNSFGFVWLVPKLENDVRGSEKMKEKETENENGQILKIEENHCNQSVVEIGDGSTTINHHFRLVVGINTVPRVKNNTNFDYVSSVIHGFAKQINDSKLTSVVRDTLILVFNNIVGGHTQFDKLKEKYGKHYNFLFLENTDRIYDPWLGKMEEPDDFNNIPCIPGHNVRQQTCDIVRLSQTCQKYGQYLMLVEDDFLPCSGCLEAVHYVIDKANIMNPGWNGIRVSYGMNGIILPTDDLTAFTDFLMDELNFKPPDHLYVFWIGKLKDKSKMYLGDRVHSAFRYNLFTHMGAISSLRETRSHLPPPPCWSDFSSMTWVEDKFLKGCGNKNDVSPCPGRDSNFFKYAADRVDLEWSKSEINNLYVERTEEIVYLKHRDREAPIRTLVEKVEDKVSLEGWHAFALD